MGLLNKRPLFTAILAFLISAVISVEIIHRKAIFFVFVGLLTFLLVATIIIKFARKRSDRTKSVLNTVIFALLLATAVALYQYLYTSSCFYGNEGEPIKEAAIKATITEISYSSDNYTFFIAEVDNVNGEKLNQKFEFEFFGSRRLNVGDIFGCVATVTPLHTYGITYEESYDAARGATACVTDIEYFEMLGDDESSVYRFLDRIRSYIHDRISSAYDGDGADFIISLVLGKKDTLDSAVRSDFRVLGISHMLAISGMHISILIFGVQYLLSALNIGKRFRVFAAVLLAFFYIGISGLAASAIRAAFMLCSVSLATFARRDTDPYTALATAVAVILIIQPYSVYDIGLWLSFLATFGILVSLTFINEKRYTRHAKIINSVLNYTRASLYMSLFAFIFTLPVVCFAFGYISTLMPLANLLFSFVVEILMYASFLIPLFLFWEPYIRLCAWLGEGIILLADICADAPYTIVSATYPAFIAAMAAFSLYFIYLMCKTPKSSERVLPKIMIAFSLLLAVLLGCICFSGLSSELMYICENDDNNEYIISRARGNVTVFDLSDATNSSAYYLANQTIRNQVNEIDDYVIVHYNKMYANSIAKLSSYTSVKRVLLPHPTSDVEAAAADRIVESLKALGIDFQMYDREETTKLKRTQFRIGCIEDEKYSYFLQIRVKNTILTYFTPQVLNYLSNGDIEGIADGTDAMIIGKHGGRYTGVMSFSISNSISHFIMSNEEAWATEEFAANARAVNSFTLLESAKIKVK